MRIAVVGAGSIGLLVASYLAEREAVTLFTRSEEQANELQLGIDRRFHEEVVNVQVHAEMLQNLKEQLAPFDIVILAVKQYHLEDIMSQLAHFRGTVVFLQNGFSHIGFFEQLRAQCLLGIVEHGAMRINGNSVIHTGLGRIIIGSIEVNPQLKQAMKCLAACSSTNFPIELSDQIEQQLQEKLVVNAVINPLTAVFRVTNGQLLTSKTYHYFMEKIFQEACSALEIPMEQQNQFFNRIEDICKRTAENRSSMLRDVEEGRATEIESILGYILKVAIQKQIDVPILHAFYQLVISSEKE